MLRHFLLGCLLLLLAGGAGTLVVWQWWQAPRAGALPVELLVDRGSSLTSVSRELADADLLRWPRLWQLVARARGEDQSIKRGEYRFEKAMSPADLLQALLEGSVITYKVTLPEGISIAEALAILQAQEPLRALLDGESDPRLLALARDFGPYDSAEGLFFPDTYLFERGQADLDVLQQAHQRLRQVLDQAWSGRDVGLPLANPYEALVLASIVERETGVPSERGQIAGVFVRRLEAGMRLQSDPTVIYGLGADFDGNLRRSHLKDDGNPYNTYRIKGLPPTPIALPGADAIRAVANPSAGSALYFVARGDGSHQFSDTLEQHTAAVRQYQLRRRSDYRSSPPASGQMP